jgi:hypothetical protein
MILLNSALCANCSLLVLSSISSEVAKSAPVFSILVWSDSIFLSVLSRNGALNVMASPCSLSSLISSFRGFLLSTGAGADGTLLGLLPVSLVAFGLYGYEVLSFIWYVPFYKGICFCHLSDAVCNTMCHDLISTQILSA